MIRDLKSVDTNITGIGFAAAVLDPGQHGL